MGKNEDKNEKEKTSFSFSFFGKYDNHRSRREVETAAAGEPERMGCGYGDITMGRRHGGGTPSADAQWRSESQRWTTLPLGRTWRRRTALRRLDTIINPWGRAATSLTIYSYISGPALGQG